VTVTCEIGSLGLDSGLWLADIPRPSTFNQRQSRPTAGRAVLRRTYVPAGSLARWSALPSRRLYRPRERFGWLQTLRRAARPWAASPRRAAFALCICSAAVPNRAIVSRCHTIGNDSRLHSRGGILQWTLSGYSVGTQLALTGHSVDNTPAAHSISSRCRA
jgi:hypothetical protein